MKYTKKTYREIRKRPDRKCTSVRVEPEIKKRIIKEYGSFTRFVDAMITEKGFVS